MKLLVLSDSHKRMQYMYQAVEREKPDLIIHLGDHDRDASGACAATAITAQVRSASCRTWRAYGSLRPTVTPSW